MSIPFVEEELVKHLLVEAFVEGLEFDRFLLGNLHLGFGFQQALFGDLLLFNG